MRTLHLQLIQQTADAYQLRWWEDNPNEARPRTLPFSEIADLAKAAEADYYAHSAADLADVGRRLYRWLDGDARWLTGQLAGMHGHDVVCLAIATAQAPLLAHLPWELLHDDASFLLHRLNCPVLPIRWTDAVCEAHAEANRPLQLLFMASSPEDVRPILDYEREEAAIIEATRNDPLDLLVEETGHLDELAATLAHAGQNAVDVLHVTGHADHHPKTKQPVFLLEKLDGNAFLASPEDFAHALQPRPPLLFLSGCKTGQNPVHGEVRSLAEQLVGAGFRAVLGWGRPVRDGEAILAAQHFYANLAAGFSIPLSLVRTHAELQQQERPIRDWHLLRFFCAGAAPGALVTPLNHPQRKRRVARPAEKEFLDPLTHEVKVAPRSEFVGRRRLLQRAIRAIRSPEDGKVGLLFHGQGGRGKSSAAARICDRVRDAQRVVVIGNLDEVSFVNAWAPTLKQHGLAQTLRNKDVPLDFRIARTLEILAESGEPAPLFIFDDFEQNQPDVAHGRLDLVPGAIRVLEALLPSLLQTNVGRVLITCRYTLPETFARFLAIIDVPPFDDNEQLKHSLRLDQKHAPQTKDATLLKHAKAAADGNPRLFEWLHRILEQPGLDHTAILAAMQGEEQRFREKILARELIASLPLGDRMLLGELLLFEVPIPFEAIRAFEPSSSKEALPESLRRATGLSLLDFTQEGDKDCYRVPRQLEGASEGLLAQPHSDRLAFIAQTAFPILQAQWDESDSPMEERKLLQLIRLAALAKLADSLAILLNGIGNRWWNENRYAEIERLFECHIEAAKRHPLALSTLAQAKGQLGDGSSAGILLHEAQKSSNQLPKAERVAISFRLIQHHKRQGELDTALALARGEILALTEDPENMGNRAHAFVHIADILEARGQFDEALDIRKEEQLPVYKLLGDTYMCAVTLGQIADILQARGQLEEALKIRMEEELSVYERLGDVRSRAVTLGKIADILEARGQLDEALKIRTEEELPVYERLGEVHSRAVTLGKIANILQARGQLEEALKIRTEEQLPVFERLGDVRSRAVTLGYIADILEARGQLEEALKIRTEEQLPVFEWLGDVRSRAVTLGYIADILQARGQLEEALKIRTEEQLPVFERLGDVRSRAVTLGQIADILRARGQLEEALKILKEEQLPVFERMNDVRSLIVCRVNIALILAQREGNEDGEEIAKNLMWSYRESKERGYALTAQIESIMRQFGFPDEFFGSTP